MISPMHYVLAILVLAAFAAWGLHVGGNKIPLWVSVLLVIITLGLMVAPR